MATFRLLLAVPERKDTNISAQEDNALHIWAFSPRRTKWKLACAFIDPGYSHRKYHMYDLYDNPDGTLKVKFVNFRDARLLYGHAFHCGCEMVLFTGANIFTNYWNRFPKNGKFIHSVLPELSMTLEVPPRYPTVPPMAPVVMPPYPEVSMSQEPPLSLDLSLAPMSRVAAGGTD